MIISASFIFNQYANIGTVSAGWKRMVREIIPIYGKSEKGGSSYTIYLDLSSQKTYKGDHRELNQANYWFAFFGGTIAMRTLAEISLPDTWLVKLLIIVIGIPISIFIGKISQRRSIGDLREIYLYKYMLDDYLEQGKKLMMREIIFTLVILIIAIILCILFILHNWLVSIIFSFISFAIVGMLMNGLSIIRWKLYKNGLQNHL